MATYTAKSLDDIAQLFERNAEYERKIANDKAYAKYRQKIAAGRSNVWLEAARILRDTALKNH